MLIQKKKETKKKKRPKEHFDLICIWINIFFYQTSYDTF